VPAREFGQVLVEGGAADAEQAGDAGDAVARQGEHVAGLADLLGGHRRWPPQALAAGAGGVQALAGAFRDELADELGQGREDVEDQAAALLTAVRKAALPQARVLVIETILADVPGPDWSKIMDIIMLHIAGGRQRTRSEHEELLNTAGFRLERVIPAMSDVSILEAVPG